MVSQGPPPHQENSYQCGTPPGSEKYNPPMKDPIESQSREIAIGIICRLT